MKHTASELLELVYRHYPRGLARDDPAYKESEEHRRLVAACRKAANERRGWLALLERFQARFAGHPVQDRSLQLAVGGYDACYSATMSLPVRPEEHGHSLGVLASILVPCYVVYSWRVVDDLETEILPPHLRPRVFFAGDTCIALAPDPNAPIEPDDRTRPHRTVLSLDLAADEQPFASWFSHELEASWGYEPMRPELGKTIVPDVATNSRPLGEATIYDCLLSDDW